MQAGSSPYVSNQNLSHHQSQGSGSAPLSPPQLLSGYPQNLVILSGNGSYNFHVQENQNRNRTLSDHEHYDYFDHGNHGNHESLGNHGNHLNDGDPRNHGIHGGYLENNGFNGNTRNHCNYGVPSFQGIHSGQNNCGNGCNDCYGNHRSLGNNGFHGNHGNFGSLGNHGICGNHSNPENLLYLNETCSNDYGFPFPHGNNGNGGGFINTGYYVNQGGHHGYTEPHGNHVCTENNGNDGTPNYVIVSDPVNLENQRFSANQRNQFGNSGNHPDSSNYDQNGISQGLNTYRVSHSVSQPADTAVTNSNLLNPNLLYKVQRRSTSPARQNPEKPCAVIPPNQISSGSVPSRRASVTSGVSLHATQLETVLKHRGSSVPPQEERFLQDEEKMKNVGTCCSDLEPRESIPFVLETCKICNVFLRGAEAGDDNLHTCNYFSYTPCVYGDKVVLLSSPGGGNPTREINSFTVNQDSVDSKALQVKR